MFKIDCRSSIPIYEQIELEVKALILKGTLKPGMKLLSVREMSLILNINYNTINKDYKELQRDGTIEKLRGKNIFIVENYKKKVDEKKLEYISEKLKKLILEASYGGINKENFIELSLEIYSKLGMSSNDRNE